MRLSRMQWAVVVAGLFAVGGITLATLPRVMNRSLNHYQEAACIKLGNLPVASQALYESLEPFNYGCFSAGWWESPSLDGLTEEVKKLNPRFQAGSYLTVFSIAEWMAPAREGTLIGDWRDAMWPYLAMTTEGDTARIYPKAWVVNFLQPGAIEAARGVWQKHLTTQRASQVKWLMLDFCSAPLPDMMPPRQEPVDGAPGQPVIAGSAPHVQHGWMDLDQDGLDHWHDMDEIKAWRDVNVILMGILREIRPDIFLIPNGSLAIMDSGFRKEVHGCYVEGFPQWFFGGAVNYQNALDPDYHHSLQVLTRPGAFRAVPGYVMVEDTYDRGVVGHIAALLDGVIEVRRSHDDVQPPRPPLDMRRLGAPQAGPVYQPGLIQRQFQHGIVSIRIASPSSVSAMVQE